MSSPDHRKAAEDLISDLIALLEKQPQPNAPLIDEANALKRAVVAFHLEGIRFRIYNVDRLLTHGTAPAPEGAEAIVADARHHLEAAGFHTRSHQAPT